MPPDTEAQHYWPFGQTTISPTVANRFRALQYGIVILMLGLFAAGSLSVAGVATPTVETVAVLTTIAAFLPFLSVVIHDAR